MAELTPASVIRGLRQVRDRIGAAGGDPDAVRVIAVTKGFGPEAVIAAAAAGCLDIGENYAQEVLAKAPASSEASVNVHFLGGIQRNKVGRISPHIHVWQSVDRLEVGAAIARHSPAARVLVQVDLLDGARPDRSGVTRTEAAGMVEQLQALGLVVEGLMAVGPPPPADPEPGFRDLSAMAREFRLAEVSMGMSGDLEAAVRAGSTMVRVGTALFGPRPKT